MAIAADSKLIKNMFCPPVNLIYCPFGSKSYVCNGRKKQLKGVKRLTKTNITVTCIVGLQDALEGLPIVIAAQSQLFVDVMCCKLHLGVIVVLVSLMTYLMMK